IQLCMGHAPLNKYLHRSNHADTLKCPACHSKDKTVHHFLLTCPAHTKPQQVMAHALSRDFNSLKKLLSHPKALLHLFKYVEATACFPTPLGGSYP
ncbi:hypothetical protein K439DRAFT_1357118, partial [Ramaria rubella]